MRADGAVSPPDGYELDEVALPPRGASSGAPLRVSGDRSPIRRSAGSAAAQPTTLPLNIRNLSFSADSSGGQPAAAAAGFARGRGSPAAIRSGSEGEVILFWPLEEG